MDDQPGGRERSCSWKPGDHRPANVSEEPTASDQGLIFVDASSANALSDWSSAPPASSPSRSMAPSPSPVRIPRAQPPYRSRSRSRSTSLSDASWGSFEDAAAHDAEREWEHFYSSHSDVRQARGSMASDSDSEQDSVDLEFVFPSPRHSFQVDGTDGWSSVGNDAGDEREEQVEVASERISTRTPKTTTTTSIHPTCGARFLTIDLSPAFHVTFTEETPISPSPSPPPATPLKKESPSFTPETPLENALKYRDLKPAEGPACEEWRRKRDGAASTGTGREREGNREEWRERMREFYRRRHGHMKLFR